MRNTYRVKNVKRQRKKRQKKREEHVSSRATIVPPVSRDSTPTTVAADAPVAKKKEVFG